MSNKIEKEIFNNFLSESSEQLAELEAAVIELENNPADRNSVDTSASLIDCHGKYEIFRFHIENLIYFKRYCSKHAIGGPIGKPMNLAEPQHPGDVNSLGSLLPFLGEPRRRKSDPAGQFSGLLIVLL